MCVSENVTMYVYTYVRICTERDTDRHTHNNREACTGRMASGITQSYNQPCRAYLKNDSGKTQY